MMMTARAMRAQRSMRLFLCRYYASDICLMSYYFIRYFFHYRQTNDAADAVFLRYHAPTIII